jgi:PLP dependent protein
MKEKQLDKNILYPTNEQLSLINDRIKIIKENIEDHAIKANRNINDIKLMAVTKTVPPEFINAAIMSGIDLIGENRVQELLSKKDSLLPCEKHMIGTMQRNKVKQIIGEVSLIQSVDSIHLAEEIDKRAAISNITADILLEVNIGGEESKSGASKEQVIELYHQISLYKNLRLRGLMSIPPMTQNNSNFKFFENMYKLFIDIKAKNYDNSNIDILSMGMSDDYGIAIEAGSTLVRLGTAIFGYRF